MGRRKKACLVCDQKKNLKDLVQCHDHYTCNCCILSWYQQDPSKIGRCPKCRQTMEIKHLDLKHLEVKEVIHLPIPIITDPDDLTRNWLNRYSKRCPNCEIHIEKRGGCNLMTCRCGNQFCYACGDRECTCTYTCTPHLFWCTALIIWCVFFFVLILYGLIFQEASKCSVELMFIQRCNKTWPTAEPDCLAYEKELQRLAGRTIMGKRAKSFDTILENAILKSSWEELQNAYNTKVNQLEMQKKWMQFKPNCEKDIFYLSNYCMYWSVRFST